MLVVVLVDMARGIAIPLSYAFVVKKSDAGYKPGWQLGIELLSNLLQQGYPKLYVTSDSWFDGSDFIRELRSIDLHFAGELKGNRLVKGNPGAWVKWVKISEIFKSLDRVRLASRFDNAKVKSGERKAKSGVSTTALIKKYKSQLKIAAVYNAINSVNAFAYYASTDLSLTGARLWELSRARWKIECLFRDLKQFLGFGQLPCGGRVAADLAVCLPFVIYTSLRLDPPETWGLKRSECIGKMVARIREQEFSKGLNFIAACPTHPKMLKLRSRRSAIHQKPIDSSAGCQPRRENKAV